jgi:hypothetical protein
MNLKQFAHAIINGTIEKQHAIQRKATLLDKQLVFSQYRNSQHFMEF